MPIECDWHNREHPADLLLSSLHNGETQGLCQTGFMELAVSMVDAAAEAEAEASAADAVRRLDALGDPEAFPTSDGSSGEADPPAEPPSQPDSGPGDDETAPSATQEPDEAPAAARRGHGRSQP